MMPAREDEEELMAEEEEATNDAPPQEPEFPIGSMGVEVMEIG